MYLRAKPTQSLTTNYPLQPWIDLGRDRAYSEPRPYLYTTTGDMAKDTKALQYMYAPPVLPDFHSLSKDWTGVKATGGTSRPLASNATISRSNGTSTSFPVSKRGYEQSPTCPLLHPYVLFSKISCIRGSSFQVDIFVKGATSHAVDPISNPDFIGRMTRLGMGPQRSRNEKSCNKPSVVRMLDAGHAADRVKNSGGIEQVVTDLFSGREIEENEWRTWDGFAGDLVWFSV